MSDFVNCRKYYIIQKKNSIVDKLAAAMATLELLIVSEMALSWNTRDLSFTWNWSVIVTCDALCLMYVCKPYDKS